MPGGGGAADDPAAATADAGKVNATGDSGGIVLASAETGDPTAPWRVASRSDDEPAHYSAVGLASWYGPRFGGRPTANGETFDGGALTAAHPSLPLPSYVRVTNLDNGRSILLRVNDRGPYADGRLIDVSEYAANLLGFRGAGIAKVKVDYVAKAPLGVRDEPMLLASYRGPPVRSTTVVASAHTAPKPKPELVAFAAQDDEDTSADQSMMKNLTERASAVDRILMAFDVASAEN
jgi:rare lipoprotein A